MATSTRTIITPGQDGPNIYTTTQDGNIARVTIRTQTERLERQQERRDRSRSKAGQTAFYEGSGNYRRLGGDGGYRPRGIVTSGGIPVGARTPANDNLIGGMPAGDFGLNLRAIEDRIAEVSAASGPQIGDPNPNDLAGDGSGQKASPRYPQDHYYQSSTGTLWQWRTSTEEDEGEWEVISAVKNLVTVGIASPAVQQYPVIGLNDIERRIESLDIRNRLANGTAGTAGTGTLLVDGSAVTLEETILPVGGYLALNVTAIGTGILIATVTLRPV